MTKGGGVKNLKKIDDVFYERPIIYVNFHNTIFVFHNISFRWINQNNVVILKN